MLLKTERIERLIYRLLTPCTFMYNLFILNTLNQNWLKAIKIRINTPT